MPTVPACFYRISIKALILDEQKRFLLVLEENGTWNLPGGGLDFGEDVPTCVARELKEEMGLEVIQVAARPSYFITTPHYENWRADVVYETAVKNLNFMPSDECTAIKFFTKEAALQENIFPGAKACIEAYNPTHH